MLPISVKGVVYDADGDVLLGLNDRAEWELPGGRIEPGETQEQCLVREVLEETGLAVTVERHLGSWVFEVIPGAEVQVSAYGCRLLSAQPPLPSGEHRQVRFWPLDALADVMLPEVYREAISLWPPK